MRYGTNGSAGWLDIPRRLVRRVLPPKTRWREVSARIEGRLEAMAGTVATLPATVAQLAEQVLRFHNDAWQAEQARHDHIVNVIEGAHTNLAQRLNDDGDAQQIRHEHLLKLITSLHGDTWTSARLLNEHVLQRLAMLEQRIVALGRGLGTREVTEGAAVGRDVDIGAMRATTAAHLLQVGQAPAELANAVSVPSDLGPLLLPADDTVILPFLRAHGVWEPEVAEAIRAQVRPNGIVIDVGAHIGYFSILLSRLVGPNGRVIAVEADPDNFRLLTANLTRAGCHNVLPLPVAAMDRRGPCDFSRSPDRNSGDNRAFRWSLSGDAFCVPGVPLDDVIPADADVRFIKLDVQGGDHLAIRGLSKTIARCHPTIIVEFWPPAMREMGFQPTDALALYRQLDYAISAIENGDVSEAMPDAQIIGLAEATPSQFYNLLLS